MSAWRHYVMVVLFSLAVIGLCGRVVYLGVSDRDFLQEQGDARSIRSETIPAMRGVIYDRHGEPLAVSTPVFAVWTDPRKAVFDSDQIKQVAQFLDLPPNRILQRIAQNKTKGFVYLKRRVTWNDAQALRKARVPHVYLQPEYRRYYPAAETAAHLVGVTNIDDQGIEGSEYAFDKLLKGEHGSKVVLKDRHGNIIRDLDYVSPPAYGRDLTLSIDLRLQFLAYRELVSAVTSHQAKSGSIVMLDVKSGEILALVNQPSYNPNDIPEQLSGMRNRAITDAYEPGSTMKPFSAVAALESGRYDNQTLIDTHPGYFHIGRKMIRDPLNRGAISLAKSISKSSQVAFAKVALDLEEEAVYDVLRRAGVGDFLGTGLPGETIGYIDNSQLKYPVVRASMAYGYGLSLTPLQLAQAYLTLATGGIKRSVSILSDRSSNGAPPHAMDERVFDERIAREVVTMMEGVTEQGGTAPGGAVEGYKVAGKSGTVQVAGPGGYTGAKHVAWFAGMVPASDPSIVMVVVVNEPDAGPSGGGVVAAPIFSRVASRSLRLLGVPPDVSVLANATASIRGRG